MLRVLNTTVFMCHVVVSVVIFKLRMLPKRSTQGPNKTKKCLPTIRYRAALTIVIARITNSKAASWQTAPSPVTYRCDAVALCCACLPPARTCSSIYPIRLRLSWTQVLLLCPVYLVNEPKRTTSPRTVPRHPVNPSLPLRFTLATLNLVLILFR